jgi:hypothetical protein
MLLLLEACLMKQSLTLSRIVITFLVASLTTGAATDGATDHRDIQIMLIKLQS